MLRGRTRWGFLALVPCALALGGAPASAATVTNTNDSGPGSLRQAVIDAAPGETINVPAGSYTLTSGPILIEKSLAIAGAGAGSTSLRANASAALFSTGAGNNVTISGVAFRDAVREDTVVQGGIIVNFEANLTLSGVVITANVIDVTQATKPAGVIQGGLIEAVEGSLSILDSKIVGNVLDASGASGQRGGVIQGGAILYVPSKKGTLTIAGSSISGNTVDLRGGPGPSSTEQDGGTAQGGLLNVAGESPAPLTIRASSVAGNSVDVTGGPGGDGGVIQGGAILTTGASLNMTETTLAANSTRAGSGTLLGGGGMFLGTPALPIAITSSTVAGNGGEGGGTSSGGNLYLSGPVSFANTVVANGVGPAGGENCFAAEPPVSRGFNLESLDQCNFHGPGDVVNANPQLGPLAENGGPTPTMLPAASSPLVDKGTSLGLATDQRGIVRPIDFPSIPNSPAPGGDGSDIGAVELQPSNAFSLGKLTRNKKKGIARLTVNLPVPNVGTLTLSGKGLKTRTQAVTGATSSVTFVVATVGKARKALRKRGKRKVGINVTYAPLANAASTETRKAKLVKKKPHRKGKRHQH